MKNAIERIPEEVGKLLVDYASDLDEAWQKLDEDDSLAISFSAKIGLKKGAPMCDLSISFTKEKVKDKASFPLGDQLDLFNVAAKKSAA